MKPEDKKRIGDFGYWLFICCINIGSLIYQCETRGREVLLYFLLAGNSILAGFMAVRAHIGISDD